MHLSFIDIFDLFFRFAVIGQFILLSAAILYKNRSFQSILLITLIVCVGSYLLLTPQIPNHHYGNLRGILLFFSDLLPFVCWFYVFSLLDDDFHPKNWSWAANALLLGAILWLMYVFIYLQGKGGFHQIIHWVEAIVTLHILYVSIKDLQDDLVDSRRNKRMFIVFLLTGYVLVLTILELTQTRMIHTSIFSLGNSSLVFLAVNIFFFSAIKKYQRQPVTNIDSTTVKPEPSVENIPVIFQKRFDKLTQFIDAGDFKKAELTIKQLSILLNTPEHQLRELINQCLGFKNFSSFLNSYRIPAACEQFDDIENISKPILTIALGLGYGSIGPFNRSFKEITGKTPSQYRESAIKQENLPTPL